MIKSNFLLFLILQFSLQILLMGSKALAQTGNFEDSEFLNSLKNEVFNESDNPIDTIVVFNSINPFDVDHQKLARKEKTLDENKRPLASDKSILFIAMILSLALLAITIGDNKKTFGRLIRSLNNSNYLKLFYRDSRSNYPTMLIVLYLFAFISFAIFTFLILDYTNVDSGIENKTYLLVGILFLIGGLILVKHMFLNFLSFIFPIDKELKLYSFSMMLVLIAGGIFLAPVNAVIAFGDESYIKLFIYIGISVIIFFYLFQQFRGILYGSRYLVYNSFHFFLYICTVELLPMALIAKVISNF